MVESVAAALLEFATSSPALYEAAETAGQPPAFGSFTQE
jgi:hypothetical protein